MLLAVPSAVEIWGSGGGDDPLGFCRMQPPVWLGGCEGHSTAQGTGRSLGASPPCRHGAFGGQPQHLSSRLPHLRPLHEMGPCQVSVLPRKSVFRLKKAVTILEQSVRPLPEPIIEVILLPSAFVGGTGVFSLCWGAGRGAAGAGGRWRWGSAWWHRAARHRALQRRRVHVLQERCQRRVP